MSNMRISLWQHQAKHRSGQRVRKLTEFSLQASRGRMIKGRASPSIWLWIQSLCCPLPPTHTHALPARTTTGKGWVRIGSQEFLQRPESKSSAKISWSSKTPAKESSRLEETIFLSVWGVDWFVSEKMKKKSLLGVRCAILADHPWGNKLHITLYTNTAPNTNPAGSTVALLSLGK